jgi:sn-glycerol 3-phosphate transport system substrate-binding protein
MIPRRHRTRGLKAIARRDLLRACASSIALAPLVPVGCGQRSRPEHRQGRVVVKFWYAYGDLVRKVMLDLVAGYNASQTRVLVEAVHQGDYYECLAKLRTALAAGAAPTLSHVVCEIIPYLSRAGVLEDLGGYDGARGLAFVPALEQRGTFSGGGDRPLVSIPFNRSTPIAFLNARMLDEARLVPPCSWDELVNVAQALTRRDAKGEVRWGFEVPISWWYWVAMVGQAGGRLVEPDGRLSLGGEAGEKALRFWQRLVQVERVMRPPPGGDYQAWQASNESFLQGRIAMMWSSTAYVRYLEDNARFPVIAAALPSDVRASVPTGGTMFVVMRAAPDEEKQAAWDFIRWMCEAEQTITWSTRTGYLPVTRTAVQRLVDRGWYARHPNDRVAYDQLAAVDPWPWAPELFRIERDVVEPRLEEGVLEGVDAHTLMDAAREEAGRPA